MNAINTGKCYEEECDMCGRVFMVNPINIVGGKYICYSCEREMAVKLCAEEQSNGKKQGGV